MKSPPLRHDESQRIHVARLLSVHAGIRERKMFGCPAFFLDRRMVACVYGDEVGIKLPGGRVDALLAEAVVTPFQPYGKTMREWAALSQRGEDLDALAGLFDEAVAHAAGHLRPEARRRSL